MNGAVLCDHGNERVLRLCRVLQLEVLGRARPHSYWSRLVMQAAHEARWAFDELSDTLRPSLQVKFIELSLSQLISTYVGSGTLETFSDRRAWLLPCIIFEDCSTRRSVSLLFELQICHFLPLLGQLLPLARILPPVHLTSNLPRIRQVSLSRLLCLGLLKLI